MAVAGALLDTRFSDPNGFQQFVFASPHTPTSSDQPEISSSGVFNTVHKMFKRRMLNMRHKEASGVPLLAVFILNVAEKLDEQFQHQNLTFRADMEYTVMATHRAGVNPSYDTALVLKVSSQTDDQPIVLYEYKPVVDTRSDSVDVRDLLEALMQGFYCIHFRKVPSIVQCLTDMYTWYFMKLNKRQNHITIEWYKSIHNDNAPNVQTHVSFISHSVTALTQCSGLVSSLNEAFGSAAT